MGALSWWHWLIIIAAFILIFGAKRLPDAARGVGRSLRILKSEVSAMQEESGKTATPAETDASAAIPTPPAQIVATPPAAQPVAPQAAPQAAPVVNGTPVADPNQQG